MSQLPRGEKFSASGLTVVSNTTRILQFFFLALFYFMLGMGSGLGRHYANCKAGQLKRGPVDVELWMDPNLRRPFGVFATLRGLLWSRSIEVTELSRS